MLTLLGADQMLTISADSNGDTKVAPAQRSQQTVLDDVPTPTGLKAGRMRVEVQVSSPEPAVEVFTTAGTCQGRLRRHS